jgi:hypothetical protein
MILFLSLVFMFIYFWNTHTHTHTLAELTSNTDYTENFSLHHRVQNGAEAHPASYPMDTRGSFLRGKAAVAWSPPLTSIQCRGQRMSGAIPQLPNTPSWCGAQLKHRDNFTYTHTHTHTYAELTSNTDYTIGTMKILVRVCYILITS